MTTCKTIWRFAAFSFLLMLAWAAIGGRAQSPAPGQKPTEAKPGPAFRENDDIPEPLRLKTFLFVWEKVRDDYYDPTFGGVDWDSVKAKYAPEIAAARTSGAFHSLLGKMVGELRQSHMAIIPPHQTTQESKAALEARTTLEGVSLRIVEGRITAFSVAPGSPAWQSGLRPGDAILREGDRPLVTEEDIRSRPARALAAARRALAAEPSTPAVLAVLDESGREKTVSVARTTPFKERTNNLARAVLEFRRVNPRVGYIWFDGWAFDLKSKLEPALKDLWETDGLIIDLRQNRGGVNPGVDYLASVLNIESGVLGVEVNRKGERKEWAYAGGGPGAYRGRLAILVDEWSGSASEVFAGAMQENGRSVILGRTSFGGVLNSTQEMLPTGGILQIAHSDMTTAKGVRIEGRGVVPDVPVELTRTGLYHGKDAVIERAVALILEGTRK